MKTELKYLLYGLLVGVSIAIAIDTHVIRHKKAPESPLTESVDSLCVKDTNRVISPVSGPSVVTEIIKIKVPVKDSSLVRERDSLLALLGMVMNDRDSLLSIQRTQVEYPDSNYHAWVSGIAPRLDSIEVYPTKMYYNKIITKTEIVNKIPTITFGVQIGYGVHYGHISNKVDIGPYLGGGIEIHF